MLIDDSADDSAPQKRHKSYQKIAQFYLQRLNDGEFGKTLTRPNGEVIRETSYIFGDSYGITVKGSAGKYVADNGVSSVFLVFQIEVPDPFKNTIHCSAALSYLKKKTPTAPDLFGPVYMYTTNRDGTELDLSDSLTLSAWIDKTVDTPLARCVINRRLGELMIDGVPEFKMDTKQNQILNVLSQTLETQGGFLSAASKGFEITSTVDTGSLVYAW